MSPQDVLPFPPTPSASIAGRTMQESVYSAASRAAAAARGRAEHPHRPDRRRRAGPADHASAARSAPPTLDRVSRRGHRVQPLPHDGDVLADAGVAADRAQPSPRRQRPDRRAGQRLGRLLRAHPEEQRDWRPRCSSTTATAPRRSGKWHNTPAEETTAAGPFDNWPTGLGFEYFYGFLAGEASQYEPNLVRNTTMRAAAEDARGGLPPQRGPRRRRHRLAARAQGVRAGQAVLHVLGERLPARPAPHHEGVGRQVQGQVRRRLGRLPRAGVRSAPKETGLDSRRTPSSRRATRTMPAWDDIPEDEKPFQRRLMEVAAGFAEHADVQVGRLIDEIERARLRRQHADLLHLGRQRLVGRGPERHDQRAARAERHPDHGRAAHQGARRARRPRRARLAEDRQHVPRRLGLGGQHAVQGHEAAGLALRRHPQPDGRPLAGEDQAGPDAAHAVPPLQRHRADDLRGRRDHPAAGGQRRPAGPDRRRQLRLHVRRRRSAEGRLHDPVLRDHGQPRRSTTTAGWPAPSGPALPWVPGLPPGIADWTPDNDTWELYNLDEDWTQANDLAAEMPEKLAAAEGPVR